MYPFMTLPVHFHAVFLITVKIYPSTFLLFCMSTDVPLHHYNCAVYFFFFGITCTMTLQLIYRGSYKHIHAKINLLVYLHASLSSNHKDLPVTTTTCVHVNRCPRPGPYAFIFILSFRLTVKTYLFINIPVQFISYFSAYPLWWPFNSSTGVPTHRSTRKYIYMFNLMFLFRLTIKTNLSPQFTCVPAHLCTRSWPYLFIFILSFRLTV